jgi:hypothetical protein
MSTTPSALSTFWSKLKQFLPAIELAGNVALLATGIGAGVEPLVASLEQAVNPLLQSIGTQQPISSTIMTVYATIIGVLTTLKATPGLPAATLSQIDGYIIAAQDGTAGYLQAESGFNPANYMPVTPIA